MLGFAIDGGEDLAVRYNICPGLPDWVIKHSPRTSRPRFELLEWGLLPSWANNRNPTRRPINARAETVAERPMFRDLLGTRRCAVPADGYYEWRTTSSGKVPFWFRLKGREPFFFAGLWDTWHERRADAVSSYILMTTEPNELATKVHDRMPVLLHARNVTPWLDPSVKDVDDIVGLLGPYPADEMESHPVSKTRKRPAGRGARTDRGRRLGARALGLT